MYKVSPKKVYVMDRVYDNSVCESRLNAMLDSMNPDEIIPLNDNSLNELVKQRNWTKGYSLRTGAYHRREPPTFIFNTFRWKKWDLKRKTLRYPALNRALFLGQNAFTHREAINHLEHNICQAAWEMHSVFGCLHACDYCHVEDFVNIMLNIEELIQHLDTFMKTVPDLQLYKYDNLSDIPVFEPEYNACKPMVEFFATKKHQFLLLYTKSDNIDYLLDLEHKGQTIINWSIAPDTQSRLIEKDTPIMEKRIEAMKKGQESGYTVRARFSPLIPVKNWQEEIKTMIEKLFNAARPDIITLDVIGFMKPKVMVDVIDSSLFNEEAMQILKDLQAPSKKLKLYGKHTFPHEFRLEMLKTAIESIKEVSPTTPVSICNETRKMWDDLSPLLGGMTPDNYACCCGPTSVPGNTWLH